MSAEELSKIEKVSLDEKSDQLINPVDRVAPDPEKFTSLLDQQANLAPQKVEASTGPAKGPSLLEEIRNVNRRVDLMPKVNAKDLVAQAQEVVGQIEEIKQKLSAPNVEIKNSFQTVLKNKLSHIDDTLRMTLARAGVEYKGPDHTAPVSSNPIERFLGFLTHGQNQLQNLGNEVEQIHLNRETISPASMLAIQIKVNYIQQELEFFTNLLNKGLESTKTIMNVQV